jgi:hypothetical protein
MQLVLRSEAKRLGLTRYFTGKQCKHGHIVERFTNCRGCTTCSSLKSQKYVVKNTGDENTIKACSRCAVSKPIYEFGKHSTGKFGTASICKTCRKTYFSNWYAKNKDSYLLQTAKWAKENAYKKRYYRAKRIAAVLNATPTWANLKEIEGIYKQAEALSKKTNQKYEVDHIIPLQGKFVSGLHVHWNLQVISMEENRKKGNGLWL